MKVEKCAQENTKDELPAAMTGFFNQDLLTVSRSRLDFFPG